MGWAMARVTRFLAVAACCASLGTGSVVAQTNGDGVLGLVGQGQYDKARDALKSVPHNQLDQLFLEAQILAHQGQLSKAVEAYRVILAIQPGLVPVRQVLAQTLLNMEDWDAARFQFRTLMEAEPNADLRVRYANALRIIDQKTPSGINASVAVVPSTNVNRGTYNDTISNFTIDPDSQEESGVGLVFGLNGFYRKPVSGNGVVTLAAGIVQSVYEEAAFMVTQPYANVAYTETASDSIWSLTGFASKTYRDENNDALTYGLRYAARRQLSGPNTLSYSFQAQNTEYSKYENQSGPTVSMDVGLQKQISPTMGISGGVKLSRGMAEDDAFKYWSTSVYGGVSNSWRGGWNASARLELGIRPYDGDFTLLSFARDDEFAILTGSVLNSTISYGGFAPKLTCTIQLNRSNVAFYDYNAQECSFEFTRGF